MLPNYRFSLFNWHVGHSLKQERHLAHVMRRARGVFVYKSIEGSPKAHQKLQCCYAIL